MTGAELFDRRVDAIDLDSDVLTAIAKVVCRQWAIWPDQLLGRSRLAHVPLGRHVAWRLASRMTDLNARQIAEAFGRFDQATVRPWTQESAPFEPVILRIMDQLEATAWRLAAA